MKVSEIISGATPVPVPKARNLATVAWWAGYLVVQFRGRATRYIYGPNIGAEELDKILKVPYPDSLLTKLKKKHNWQCHKVG